MSTRVRSFVRLSPADAAALYLATLEAEGAIAPRTLKGYRYAIQDRFLTDTPGLPDRVESLAVSHLLAFTQAQRARGLKPGAIRSYQTPIWTWLRWLHFNHHHPSDLSTMLRRVRVRQEDRETRTATDDVTNALLVVAQDRAESPLRNVAIVLTLAQSGARRDELSRCDLADVDLDSGTLALRRTKTGEPRTIPVGKRAVLALMRYIKLERGEEPGPLFYGRQKRRLTADGVRMVLRRLAESAGAPVSSHDFRRGLAAKMLAGGVPLDVVMGQLGHRTPTMSLQYGRQGREARNIAAYREFDATKPRQQEQAG